MDLHFTFIARYKKFTEFYKNRELHSHLTLTNSVRRFENPEICFLVWCRVLERIKSWHGRICLLHNSQRHWSIELTLCSVHEIHAGRLLAWVLFIVTNNRIRVRVFEHRIEVHALIHSSREDIIVQRSNDSRAIRRTQVYRTCTWRCIVGKSSTVRYLWECQSVWDTTCRAGHQEVIDNSTGIRVRNKQLSTFA